MTSTVADIIARQLRGCAREDILVKFKDLIDPSTTLSSSPNLVQSKIIVDPCSSEDGDASTGTYLKQSVLHSDHADIERYLTQNHISDDNNLYLITNREAPDTFKFPARQYKNKRYMCGYMRLYVVICGYM